MAELTVIQVVASKCPGVSHALALIVLHAACVSWLPVLTNVAPPSLHRNVATYSMFPVIVAHPNWPIHADVFEHPRPWLTSRCPIWSDMAPVDTTTQWREDWSSASVVITPV